MVDNCMMTMRGGQVLSLNGLLGACHEMATNERDRHSLVSRMCVNGDVARSITIDNMVQHHTNEVIRHLTRNVKAIFPIMPLDIQDMLDRSPSMVVHDFIRMWSMMNQSLPFVGLTTPMFSDGATDYEPWKIGPKFFLSPLPMQMHSYTKNPTYRLYSSFIYLPKQFRMMVPRTEQEELSTDKFCWNHLRDTTLRLNSFKTCPEKSIRVNCMLRPDKISQAALCDDLYTKVPQTNSALRSDIKLCNTLKCLTLFKDHPDDVKVPLSIHFALLSGYNLAHANWKYYFIRTCMDRLCNFILYSKEDTMATSLEEMSTLFIRYLFFSEFQVNDGVCLIYEGHPIPGHGKKCSLLNREFSEPGSFHYNVSRVNLGLRQGTFPLGIRRGIVVLSFLKTKNCW